MLLEGIPNIPQPGDLDCLVTCCQQVLRHLGIEKGNTWLWRQLQASTGEITAFSNLANLRKSLGLVVEMYEFNEDIFQFTSYLESGLPILVAVDADLSYEWPYYKEHAVVVIGCDDENVYVNDPAQDETGLEVDMEIFLHAWARRGYQFAVIRLAQPS
ncbi:MAG: C39 family peptidase [Chloroflexota bacterium]